KLGRPRLSGTFSPRPPRSIVASCSKIAGRLRRALTIGSPSSAAGSRLWQRQSCGAQNMSGDPGQEYFADGIVEEIITALSRFGSLCVIVRNSTFIYKGRAVNVNQVRHELGARYVLEGSVRKAGNRVRITGQLIDALTEVHLWADRFEGVLE